MLSKSYPFTSNRVNRTAYAQDLVNVFNTQSEKRKIAKATMKRGVFRRHEHEKRYGPKERV